MKGVERVRGAWLRANVAVGMLLLPGMAAAQSSGTERFGGTSDLSGFDYGATAGDSAVHLRDSISEWGVLGLSLGQAAGIYFAYTGISDMRKNHDQPGQNMMAKGAFKTASGVGVYLLPHIIGMGGQTFFP